MSYKVGDKVLFEVNILHFDKQSTYPVQAEGVILSLTEDLTSWHLPEVRVSTDSERVGAYEGIVELHRAELLTTI